MDRFFVLEKRHQLMVLFLSVILLFSGGYILGGGLKASMNAGSSGPIILEPQTAGEIKADIVINIKGAVKFPGIYEFAKGARVNDAILRAELLPEADAEALNLAQFLKDEQEILVPVKGAAEAATDSRISLNKATAAELETIPGVGPVMAGNIISYRQSKGGFAKLEDLLEVSGIGDKTLEKLLPYVKL